MFYDKTVFKNLIFHPAKFYEKANYILNNEHLEMLKLKTNYKMFTQHLNTSTKIILKLFCNYLNIIYKIKYELNLIIMIKLFIPFIIIRIDIIYQYISIPSAQNLILKVFCFRHNIRECE